MRRSRSIIDLEIGNWNEEYKVKEAGSRAEKAKKKLDCLGRSGSLSSIGMAGISYELNSIDDESGCVEEAEISVGEGSERAENRKERRKKRISKPPRPPKAPSLEMADMKFLREMSELARLKRERKQHMKTLKKKRAEKGSSSCSNIIPMIITVVFLWVIFFQGMLGSRA